LLVARAGPDVGPRLPVGIPFVLAKTLRATGSPCILELDRFPGGEAKGALRPQEPVGEMSSPPSSPMPEGI